MLDFSQYISDELVFEIDSTNSSIVLENTKDELLLSTILTYVEHNQNYSSFSNPITLSSPLPCNSIWNKTDTLQMLFKTLHESAHFRTRLSNFCQPFIMINKVGQCEIEAEYNTIVWSPIDDKVAILFNWLPREEEPFFNTGYLPNGVQYEIVLSPNDYNSINGIDNLPDDVQSFFKEYVGSFKIGAGIKCEEIEIMPSYAGIDD